MSRKNLTLGSKLIDHGVSVSQFITDLYMNCQCVNPKICRHLESKALALDTVARASMPLS